MNTTVLLIDDNEEWTERLKNFLDSTDDFAVVGVAHNGEDGLKAFNELRPDAVVLDLVMPVRDGFGFLDGAHKGTSKIIVASALSQSSFINRAVNGGADYYLVKPCKPETVAERLSYVMRPKRPEKSTEEKMIEERITNIFITVGIPAHIKGYQFLREAIKMAVDDPEVINSITKKLYPSVALRFDTSASKVERAIRHAIEVAWNRGKIENINNLFGVRVYNHNEKPTNGEFIALVADKMLLESV
jgi:two-component system response regulator (stage 0 sporulation protein A)